MEDLQESILNLSVEMISMIMRNGRFTGISFKPVSRNDIDDNETMEDLHESLLNLSVEMISMIMRQWKIYRNLF